jgi:hypothetical protein
VKDLKRGKTSTMKTKTKEIRHWKMGSSPVFMNQEESLYSTQSRKNTTFITEIENPKFIWMEAQDLK